MAALGEVVLVAAMELQELQIQVVVEAEDLPMPMALEGPVGLV